MSNDNFLPVVSKDTLLKLDREASEGKNIMIKITELLMKENPELGDVISDLAKNSKDLCKVICTGLTVYYLLRSQAEADELEENLKLE